MNLNKFFIYAIVLVFINTYFNSTVFAQFSDGYGDDSSNADSVSSGNSIKSKKYNVLDEYSFKKFYKKEHSSKKNKKHRKHKKWVSFSAGFDTKYIDFTNSSGYVFYRKKPFDLSGFNLSTEFFPAKWFSFYLGYAKDSKDLKVVEIDTTKYQSLYTGARVYFAFLYMGIGGVYNIRKTSSTYYKPPYLTSASYWSMYIQMGADLALYKHLSLDVGLNIQPPLNKSPHTQDDFVSEGNFYIGLKFTY